MTDGMILSVAAFAAASSLVVLTAMLLGRAPKQVDARLADVARTGPRSGLPAAASTVLPSLGALISPRKAAARERVETLLRQAGFYRGRADAMFFGLKFLLMVVPLLLGLGLAGAGMISLADGVFYGAVAGLAGTILPAFWLGKLGRARAEKIRRALPDALDVIVICLEGGLSLPAAFARVTHELAAAYPLLAAQMVIVRKKIELGQSTGEAFREFADRFDSEELRSLAVLVGQSERFGASLARTLRIHADSLRIKRYQYAEGQAQKAPLKLIFPTVLCIFPALYIVLMGPAGVQLLQLLNNLG